MANYQFTEEQLNELEQLYGLKRVANIKVRDGYIKQGDTVWWRSVDGPQQIDSDNPVHLDNIHRHPQAYQIKEPKIKTIYED